VVLSPMRKQYDENRNRNFAGRDRLVCMTMLRLVARLQARHPPAPKYEALNTPRGAQQQARSQRLRCLQGASPGPNFTAGIPDLCKFTAR
jgi:hypothetical protein